MPHSQPSSPASSPQDPRALRKALRSSSTYFAKGFEEHKDQAQRELQTTYKSSLVEQIRAQSYCYRQGDITIHLAKAFGFCWGVERAVEYAYEARRRFPDRQIWITNEIIHNPLVNRHLQEMGIRFVEKGPDGKKDFSQIRPEDVVIWPAFGASVSEMEFFRSQGNEIVDTTCPWVSRVWNQVDKHRAAQFTSVIHGKYNHEETVATSSFAEKYLVVLNLEEAQWVARYILEGGDAAEFRRRFGKATSPGFDPDRDLERIGIANQTTMLEGETRAIAKLFETTMLRKYGPQELDNHFMSFNTICNATQERQDAMFELLERPLDVVVVIGGFNSSNTTHLQEIALAKGLPSFHIDGPDCIQPPNCIRHKPLHQDPIVTEGWLPDGPVQIGITSGASTPDRVVEEVILRIFALREQQQIPA
ncbi:4-hydroxy-3-methylbut-2-enyl diphosphate reductase [Synechococcus sp. H60.3]|uniref:4-hydroxy-3-methylbut-2-enyl diphosphate reductase n=1 Tax=unclassified Synechococcus TaxID=2626047 RepID=UPI0039C3CA86